MNTGKQIALTIDDLPFVSGHSIIGLKDGKPITDKLLQHLNKHNVKATGFVIGNMIDIKEEQSERINLLHQWQISGHILANHTYSHSHLSKMTLADFEEDVIKNERILSPFSGINPTENFYFRYPFLDYGNSVEQRDKALEFLHKRSYIVAPVTIDAKDYIFDLLYTDAWQRDDEGTMQYIICLYLSHLHSVIEFRGHQAIHFFGKPLSQIMLIHANRINSDCLDKVITFVQQQGNEFVPLHEVLQEPIYQSGSAVINRGQFLSWKSKTSDGTLLQVAYPNVDPTILEHYESIRQKNHQLI